MIGQQPILEPGDAHEYTSFCPLHTPIGSMHGSYQMVSAGGARFDAVIEGDTLRGTFHAGLKAQTPFVAVRAQGPSPLKPPTDVTRADTTAPFRFAFRDVNGSLVQSDDPQFRGKVLVVDAKAQADVIGIGEFLGSVVPAATIDHAFVCGPFQMNDEAEAALLAAGPDAAAAMRAMPIP